MSEPLQPPLDDSSDPSTGQQHPGLPKPTIIVSFVAIIIAVVATFIAMQWTGSRTAAQEIRTQLEEVTQQEVTVSQELGALRAQLTDLRTRTGVLAKGTFIFCNYSQEPVTIKHLTATYLNDLGEFQTFTTEPHGAGLWVIPPGTRKNLDFGQGALWDGSVTYYSLLLEAEDQQYPFAGFWKPEQTECVFQWPSG